MHHYDLVVACGCDGRRSCTPNSCVVRLRRLDGLGHRVFDVHLNGATERVSLQAHLLLLLLLLLLLKLMLRWILAVMVRTARMVELLLSRRFVRLLLLHLHLLLDASDLVADEHRV